MDEINITKNIRIGLAAGLVALSSFTASAGDLGASVRGGSLGLGLELDYKLTNNISLRLQAHDYSYSDDFEEDDIEYEGDVDLSTFGLLADWHPWSGIFRISAGAYSNGNELAGTTTGGAGEEYEIGGRTYISDATDPANLDLSVELGSGVAPYLGVGWGNSPENDGGLMVSFDLGVMMGGSPDVTLEASGLAVDADNPGITIDLATDPTAQAEIDAEIAELEDDISEFDLYPVLMLGVGYRF